MTSQITWTCWNNRNYLTGERTDAYAGTDIAQLNNYLTFVLRSLPRQLALHLNSSKTQDGSVYRFQQSSHARFPAPTTPQLSVVFLARGEFNLATLRSKRFRPISLSNFLFSCSLILHAHWSISLALLSLPSLLTH